MGNLRKNQQERKIVKADVSDSRQLKIDDLSFQFNVKRRDAIIPKKAIIINRITDTTGEDELTLKVEFSLIPSKSSFSKINLDLYFQEQLLKSTLLIIPQSQLLNDTFEHTQVLEMKGMAADDYMIRVEMYEPWSSGEKIGFTVREITIQYVPQSKEKRFLKIPTVKRIAGNDLTVVSSIAKSIYQEIDEGKKKELMSKRDEW